MVLVYCNMKTKYGNSIFPSPVADFSSHLSYTCRAYQVTMFNAHVYVKWAFDAGEAAVR